MTKYVLSFTTSPTRILKCGAMLKNILKQSKKLDAIVLNIPDVFARTNETYTIPNDFQKEIIINHCKRDYGPGTKLIPTIKYLRDNSYDENTRVIYCDDDILYPLKMVECFSKTDPSHVWTSTGFHFVNFNINGSRKHKDNATIAEGYGAVCTTLSMFKDDFESYIDTCLVHKELFLSDDIILSNYFAKHSNEIKIFGDNQKYSIFYIWNTKSILEYGNENDALHCGASGTSTNNASRYKTALGILSKAKMRYIKLHFMTHGKLEVR